MAGRLLIVGASARAAAASARRGGFAPVTVDLFADQDTRELADEAYRCDPNDYPHGLARVAAGLPPTPWLYTGGLENHPDVVAAIGERHDLLGNGPATLAKVRDRAWLRAAVAALPGVTTPDALAPDEPTPAAGRWVWKPDKGSGGAGVRLSPPGETGGHRERFHDGPVYGATFVTGGGRTVLWGVAEQLVGEPWLNAKPFAYRGSVGPVPLSDDAAAALTALGYRLATAAGLAGAWNVDCVGDPAGEVRVLEVNPRVTAAVDVLDLPPRAGLVGAHVRACRGESVRGPNPPFLLGKAVYFAPRRLAFPGAGRLPAGGRYADLPAPGEVIEAGRPVLTLLTPPGTRDECTNDIRSRAAKLDRLFAPEAAACTP